VQAAKAIQVLLLSQTWDDEYNLELVRLLNGAVYEGAVLWGKETDGLVEGSWLYSEPEAGQGADAVDGTSGYFSP